MRKARAIFISSLFIAASIVCLASSAEAQTRDKFVISARAGGVNAVTGKASVRGRRDTEWTQLTIKEDLETGDVVKTGADGRVEMLLNPGSYLRIGENSEFELSNNSLDNLEVRLTRGTAIVEATGAEDTALQINVTTPHTRLAIVRRGLYRLNVVPGDNTELIVRKGRVMLNRSQTKIQGGSKVVFNQESFFIAKLTKVEKKQSDGLDTWSKDRAETVAQVNKSIRRREMAVLMASYNDHWARGFGSGYGGFWYFHPRAGCYTFVPFLLGWGSPYGASYSFAYFGNYYCCGRGPFGEYYGGSYPSATTNSASGGGSSAPSRPSPSAPSSPSPSVERSLPPAMEGRILRHQDRSPAP